ncbi:MAG: hypothetical protein JJ879_04105 [Sneathiella sp.]|nr:hypothetical protein [Sneathiella sp.]
MNIYPDKPGHRNVETLIAATKGLAPKLERHQRMAESAIRHATKGDLTVDELAVQPCVDRWSIQSRTSELKQKSLIRDIGLHCKNGTGKRAIFWVST